MEQTPNLSDQTPRRSHLTDTITKLAEPLLASLGLSLWGLEYTVAGKGHLRLFIEKVADAHTSGVHAKIAGAVADDNATDEESAESAVFSDGSGPSVDECAHASRLIGMRLEVEDLIDIPYVLEVSSPGLERRFFTAIQLAAYAGKTVDLHFHDAPEGHGMRKHFRGVLANGNETPEEPEGERSFTLQLAETNENEPDSLHFSWPELKKAQLVYIEPPKGHTPKKRVKTSGGKK